MKLLAMGIVFVVVLSTVPNLGAAFKIKSILEELTQNLDATKRDASIETKALVFNADRKHCRYVDVAWVQQAVAQFGGDAVCEFKDTDLDTCLHFAALDGEKPIVTYLLTVAGCPVEPRSIAGDTPLHLAAWEGHSEIVRLLLQAGARVDVRDSTDRTPLHWAADYSSPLRYIPAEYGGIETVRLLLDAGAPVDWRTMSGMTPLHEAARSGYDQPEIARLLIDAGADIEAKDRGGRTPLHLASLWGNVGVLRLLVRAGARLEERTNFNETALRLAILFAKTIQNMDITTGSYPMTGIVELLKAGASMENARNSTYRREDFERKMKDAEVVKAIEEGRNQRLLQRLERNDNIDDDHEYDDYSRDDNSGDDSSGNDDNSSGNDSSDYDSYFSRESLRSVERSAYAILG